MINLTVDEVISIHEKLIKTTGGLSGIRDKSMLESAVYSAIQSFDGNDIYPTPCERAARLAFSITMNHSFLDGNKRIGIMIMLMTLKLNGISIQYTQQELIILGLTIADGTLEYSDILEWIQKHHV